MNDDDAANAQDQDDDDDDDAAYWDWNSIFVLPRIPDREEVGGGLIRLKNHNKICLI